MEFREHANRDIFTVSAGMAKAWINLYMKQYRPSAKSFLDIGTGFGYAVQGAKELGLMAVGLDLRTVYDGPKGCFVQADATAPLPFKDASFDIIQDRFFSSDLYELQDASGEDLERVKKHLAGEVDRVLRPGGIIVGIPFSCIGGHLPKNYTHAKMNELGDELYKKM